MRRIIDYLLNKPPLLVFILIGLVWILIQAMSGLGHKPNMPQITIKHVGLCLNQYSKPIPVNTLSIHDKPYVCADLESDTYPIHITLLVYKGDGIFSVYSAANEFKGNTVLFQLSLPEGEYRAKLMYARRVLAEFKFDVIHE